MRCINSFPINKSGNILIVTFNRLGDSVFTIPAVKELRDYYKNKDREVIILTFPECKPIYQIILGDVKIISVGRDGFKFNSRFASLKTIRLVKRLSPEIIFDITGSITSSFLIAQSHASKIIGINQKYYKSFFTDFVSIRKTPDLMDRYLEIVKKVKDIENPDQIKQFPVSYNSAGKIFINPFSGWKAKEWNLRKFIELADNLSESYEVNFICERDQLPGFILDELELLRIPVIYTDSIADFMCEIDKCALFIGNDTGPLHIANLVGKPTYAIFGPTSVKYPYSPDFYHRFIQKILPCSPIESQYCFTNAGRNCPSYECMNNLTVEEVSSDLMQFINFLGLKKKIEQL